MHGSMVETGMNPLLMLSLILLAGLSGGWLAQRIGIPRITGNILAGVIIGPAALNLFSDVELPVALRPLTNFAMALVVVSVGSHLSYRRIHNALGRIMWIALGESLLTLLLVGAVSLALGVNWVTAFVLGAISLATSPATTVGVVREMRAKGTYIKTLLSVVALDNILCIMLFAFARMLMGDFYEHGGAHVGSAVLHTALYCLGASLLGLAAGFITERFVRRYTANDFTVVFIALLLSLGVSEYFGLNPLLTCLFFGIYLGNSSEEAERHTQALEPLELLLFSCFFTIAGASLHLSALLAAGVLCMAYLFARAFGKVIGATLGGWLSGASPRIWKNAGLGLMPQAGVAVGLILLLHADERIDADARVMVESLVVGAIVIIELIGPFFTKLAIRRAKEEGKDRRRLIEFLQEEYILTGLEATDKWDALRQVTDFYIRTHRTPQAQRQALHDAIVEREQELTTAIGRGAAIPHGRIQYGSGIRGVLAICDKGIDFGAPDGEPVRIVMLVVTPKGYEKAHLEVMASLAQMISNDAIRTRLLAAINPNDAWEIIEDEEARSYNYFLEEDMDSRPAAV